MVRKNKQEKDENNTLMCGKMVDVFYVLPEGCIATAISFTGPRDACRLAAVSKVFKSAADSDSVWASFLPDDVLLSDTSSGKELGSFESFFSKKDLFFYLCDHPILLDGNTKSLFLDKSSGKKCITLSAKELAITWGDTPRYWAFRPSPDSRFPEVAELNSVCWLEIRGRVKPSTLSPNTTYVAYLVFKMGEAAYGFYNPAQVTITTKGRTTKPETRKVYLQNQETHQHRRFQIISRRASRLNRIRTPSFEAPPPATKEDRMLPKERKDGWMEVAIGEFYTRVGDDEDIEMSILEVEGGNWKSGLIVEGIEMRPKLNTP